MIIEQTIHDSILHAERLFGVPERAITRGGFLKYSAVVTAREWVVGQHPELSTPVIARHLGYADHTAVVKMRKRMAARDKEGHKRKR